MQDNNHIPESYRLNLLIFQLNNSSMHRLTMTMQISEDGKYKLNGYHLFYGYQLMHKNTKQQYPAGFCLLHQHQFL